MASPKYNIIQPLLLAIMVALGMAIGLQLTDDNKPLIYKSGVKNDGSIGRLEEILRFIESKYVADLDDSVLTDAALYSMLKELDPHSIYISPEDIEPLQGQMKGSYFGLGIETIFYRDTLTIVKVIGDSPAEKSGLKKMQKILAINGNSVKQDSNHTLVRDYLTDPEYVKTELVISSGMQMTDTINIERADVPVSSVDLSYTIEDSIGYIRINKFSNNVYKDFMLHLEKITKSDAKHLVLDLRSNPGGYLPEAVNILSQLFVQEDKLLVYTEGKNDEYTEYKSTGKPFFPLDRIAVLVDQGSASGSEIIAGAIQDWDRGVIVGEATYGKGLVQEQFPLSNGGAIRLTVAKYYTPSGRCIQKPYGDKVALDTIAYTTKLLNRPLTSEGGIIPDLHIHHDSINTKLLAGQDENIAEFALRYIENHAHIVSEEETKASLSSNNLLATYDSRYSKINISELDVAHQRELRTLLTHKILSYKYHDTIADEYVQRDDSYIKAAVSALKRKELLALRNE